MHKLHGTSNLYVNSNQQDLNLYDFSGNCISIPDDTGKHLITFYGKQQSLDATWLKLMGLFGINDSDGFNNITFVENSNIRSQLRITVIYNKPKYVDYDRKYRIVPGYPTVAVSNTGDVVDSVLLTPISIFDIKGYKYISVYFEYTKKYMNIGIHRLVALAWVYNNDPDERFVVNHIDGNKSNNHYTNLEWTTYKENNEHAINSSLRNRLIPSKVRCVETGEILIFSSLGKLASFLGYAFPNTFISLHQYRKNKLYTVNNKNYEVRIGGDNTPWIYTEENNIVNQETSRYIIEVIEDNGTKLVFNGSRALIKHYKLWDINYNVKVVVKELKKRHPNFKVTVTDQYDTRPIEVLNILNNEVRMFNTIKEVVQYTSIPQSRISYLLKTDGSNVYNNWRLRRATNNKPWPKITINKCASWDIKVFNKTTKEYKTFTSLRDAASFLGCDRDKVKRMIEKPKESDDFIVEKTN